MQAAKTDNIHGGHRERMRSKFLQHGKQVFETYELLEMLLYYVIPYKDTNPIAKNLLRRFSNLEGISKASTDELLSVDGVGRRVADFLRGISKAYDDIVMQESSYYTEQIRTQEQAGELFVQYFSSFKEPSERTQKRVVMALLDSSMRLISLAEPYRIDFESGAVKSRPFIEAAIAANAAVVMLAHNHSYGPAYATPADIATNRMIRDALAEIDVDLAEHFIIVGNEYVGFSEIGSRMRLRQNLRLNSFVSDCAMYRSARRIEKLKEHSLEKESKLVSLVSLVEKMPEAEIKAGALSRFFIRPADLFSSDFYVLKKCTSEKVAMFLKLFSAICIRRMTEHFEFGKPHTPKEIAEYLTALVSTEPRECIYIMLFDEKSHVISCDFVTEGTVNASGLSPRRLVELIKLKEAREVIICHNHPGGVPQASGYDMSTTVALSRVLETVGIKLRSHYIISGRKYSTIDLKTVDGELIPVNSGVRDCYLGKPRESEESV